MEARGRLAAKQNHRRGTNLRAAAAGGAHSRRYMNEARGALLLPAGPQHTAAPGHGFVEIHPGGVWGGLELLVKEAWGHRRREGGPRRYGAGGGGVAR